MISRSCSSIGPTVVGLLVLAIGQPALGGDALSEGDRAYARRHEGASATGVAQAEWIDRAVASYQKALAEDPDSLEIRTRLLHALMFRGQYVPGTREERKRVFEEGRSVFEEGRDRLSERLELPKPLSKLDPPEVAEAVASVPGAGAFFFMGSVHWGLWGENFGSMASVRKGVATKIRDLGETARLLDESYSNGGPLRLLGRLNLVAPRVPFFTRWIDRDKGLAFLEGAFRIAPDDPLNQFFLADGLLEHAPERADEGRSLLCQLRSVEPRPGMETEDAEALAMAATSLRERGGDAFCRD